MRKVCKNVSPRPTDFFCSFCWNDSACTPVPATCRPRAAPFTQLFSQSLSFHTLCSCLDILSTTNNLCNFWHIKFQQISTYAFCSWDDIITQKWKCSSPNNFCKCNESSSTLSTNTSMEWNLYLTWSNQLVMSFRLETNAGGFSEHQNKTSDTDGSKFFFHRSCLSSQCEYYEKFIWAAVRIAGC